MRRLFPIFLPLVFSVAACSGVTYENQQPYKAKLKGEVAVFWLAEGDQNAGDGKFIYVPIKTNPLVLSWVNGKGQWRDTQPGIMFTDGGSIPKLAQGISGYSPWGYAPAYMVHDWVFEARQCVRKGVASEEQKRSVEGMDFDDSVRIMAQAIAALVEMKLVSEKGTAPSGVTAAVGTPITRQLWEVDATCDNSDDFAAIAKKYDALANGQRSVFRNQQTYRILTQPSDGSQPQLVGRMSF